MPDTHLNVFVAHSMDKRDEKLIEALLQHLNQHKFHFHVSSGSTSQGRPIGEKVADLIDGCDVILGIFTREYVDSESAETLPLPSTYIVSECSYALGLSKHIPHKHVHGIRERGIPVDRLGLISANGHEMPEFDRSAAVAGKDFKNIDAYLKDIYERHFEIKNRSLRPYYTQRNVRKTVEVYRSGLGVFKHKVTIAINDVNELAAHGFTIPHQLSLPTKLAKFPRLEEMLKFPLKERARVPVFNCFLLSRANRDVEDPLHVEAIEETDHLIRFAIHLPRDLKNNDTVGYQFVWSMPNAFYVHEEEMTRDKVIGDQEISLSSRYGKIPQATLRVKFERETIHGSRHQPLFSKSPYLLSAFSAAESAPTVSGPDEIRDRGKDSIFEIYEKTEKNVEGSLIIKWRPVSCSHIQKLKMEPIGPGQGSSENSASKETQKKDAPTTT